jgi:TolB-like protein
MSYFKAQLFILSFYFSNYYQIKLNSLISTVFRRYIRVNYDISLTGRTNREGKNLMRKLIFICIPVVFLLTVMLHAQESEKIKIAILEFSNTGGISLQESNTLTNRLRSMIVNTKALIVLERGKMEEILSEQGFQQSGCTSTECAVEVGKLLNVQKMVSGSIGRLGNTFTIDLSLIDVKTAQIEKSFTRDYKGEVDGLLKVMESLSSQIAVTAVSPQKSDELVGNIYLDTTPPNAEVYLDQVYMGSSPLNMNNIRAGAHIIKIKAEGFSDEEQQIEVIPNKVSSLTIPLKKIFMVTINSNPGNAQVIINNQNIGQTPFSSRAKEGTEVNLVIKKENYDPWTKNFVVSDNVNINADLKKGTAVREKKSGGGGKTLLWVGVIAVAGGGAAYFLTQEKKKDVKADSYQFPTPPARPGQ